MSTVSSKSAPAPEAKKNQSIIEQVQSEVEKIIDKITDLKPLPNTFKKSTLTELYVCRTILFASFTLGIRAGGLSVFYFPLREILGYFFLFCLTYGVIPVIGCNIAYALSIKKINEAEFKFLMIIWSFLAGLLSIANNVHYSMADYGPPTYFMPVIVGLTFNAIGEQHYQDRKALLIGSVGTATIISITLLLVTLNLSFSAIISVILCTLNAGISLQLLIADVNEKGDEVVAPFTHLIGVLMLMINYLVISRLFGKFNPDPSRNNVNNATPFHSLFSQ